jgi:ADP-ribose pyrophosphatase YjhB (NUDIX family)
MEDLSQFPRPNVAVDIAVLTVEPAGRPGREPGHMMVLTLERTADPVGMVLPGRFLRPEESVADCARVALRDKAGVDAPDAVPHLLQVFDQPGRDPRGWTLSLGHFLALHAAPLRGSRGRLIALDRSGGLVADSGLLFDHARIVSAALERLRADYAESPDPAHLLNREFTLTQLRAVHEAVAGEPLQRDTFRRHMEPQLTPVMDGTKQKTHIDGGRPARLWRVN